MKRLEFNDYEDFACKISNSFDSLRDSFGDVSIIAKYDEAKEVINELIRLGYSITSIDIHDPNWNNYDDEYLISLNFDGVWCEPMKSEDGYITDEAIITYVLDNCSSACIPYCKGKFVYEVGIGEDDDSNGSDDRMEQHVEFSKDNNMHGFIASKSDGDSCYSMSFYSTDKLSMADIQSLMQEALF